MTQLSRAQITTKPATRSGRGIVAAQHRLAAEVGAEVLAAGGNAVDAAVAVSFAIGVVEPWMSGPAGGGAMMLHMGAGPEALYYGMRAPAGLNPADYPLSGEEVSGDLFPWKAVVDDRNVIGATAVAVPGVVDGIGKAHARYGRMPWAELIAPAVKLAKEGIEADWYLALLIASSTRALSRDPDAAARFLEDGQWPTVANWTALSDKRIDMSSMAPSLQAIADEGARALYDGDLGAALAADVEAKGGSLRRADLQAYQAVWQEARAVPYRDAMLWVTPHLTAGPTIADVFSNLSTGFTPGRAPDAAAYAAYAEACDAAYAKRLANDGDMGNDDPRGPACTTHFSIVDAEGNMVAMTQTLLSIFGSRVVSPSTGLLLNNGIMWFDPEPGRPNSLAGGKRCLMNVCPVLGEAGGKRFAIGASGGRKIMPAVAQLASFLTDFGMGLDAAFHQPRIDASGDTVIADDSLPASVIESLEARGRVVTTRRAPFPFAFACPAGVLRDGEENFGATEIMSPWGEAIAG
ncbi:gamma-glutamyltransferase [Oceanicella sp. SM1341]|uniref:gamma-glutamyltransferase n=1 Tax=Oceanicella sp. SM1341 TaxID=1548889 RepID=UPI000E50067A|nr:gamma-glutamyltransferase [Oceanicella sp. SM1341]